MYQFFIQPDNIKEDEVWITDPQDVNHIRNVLRMKKGEKVSLCCEAKGKEYICSVEEMEPDIVRAAIIDINGESRELPVKITLFQGLPKSDKMEWIIQKAVELGVYTVIPVAMKNCVVKLDEKKAQNKCKRWQAIAESAAKQSKRTVIPQIQQPLSWKQALAMAEKLDVTLVPYENERGMQATRECIRNIKEGASIGIMIGPEGGFSPEEIEDIQPPMHRISLGRRILRTETAGLATLAMLIYELDI